MKHPLNGRDRYALLWRSAVLLCFLTITGFQCDDDVDVPPNADVGADGFNVGHTFGHPRTDANWPGVGDPCRVFTGGVYRIKKVVVEVVRQNADGTETAIYPMKIYKDGVHFRNGNPNSPIGSGMGFKIPYDGAFRIKTKVYGYPCDELPNPNGCLHCCGGDASAAPYWEENSPWHDAKTDRFPFGYYSYPEWKYCI